MEPEPEETEIFPEEGPSGYLLYKAFERGYDLDPGDCTPVPISYDADVHRSCARRTNHCSRDHQTESFEAVLNGNAVWDPSRPKLRVPETRRFNY